MKPMTTSMNIAILHISELSAIVLTGKISLRSDRIAFLEDHASIDALLEQAGYLKHSEPEAYLLCIPKFDLLKGGKFDNTVIQMCAEDLLEIIPLTNDAKRSLNPTTERLHLKLSNPRWEMEWARYVDKAILNDRLLAARKFASFFDISFLTEALWTPKFDTYQFIISDIGIGQSQIEKQMEFADLGVLEFCIRIANNHDKTWRAQDANYSSLKSQRLKYLSSLNKKDFSFIDSPEICNALKLFEEESRECFGYSPFTLVAFFEIYRRHLISKKFDLSAIRSLAIKLVEYKLNQDASEFIHLVGYASGLELIMPLDYSLNNDKYSIIKLNDPLLPKLADLSISPFCGIKSAFELPPVVLLETSAIPPEPEVADELKSEEENLVLPATLDESLQLQEGTLPTQNKLDESDFSQNSLIVEKETPVSPASEPAIKPCKVNNFKKTDKQASSKEVKSKKSST